MNSPKTKSNKHKESRTTNTELFQIFSQSKLLQNFAIAFEAATKLPLRLEDADNRVSKTIGTKQNSFCQAMQEGALTKSVCEACHHRIRIVATQDPVDCPCYFGLRVHVAPVGTKGKPFAYLSTCLFPEHEFQAGLPETIETTLKNLGAANEQIIKAQLSYRSGSDLPGARAFEGIVNWLNTFCSLASERAPDFYSNDSPSNPLGEF